MRLGVHVRVYADGHGRLLFQFAGDAIDALQLRLALHVETVNALAQGEGNLLFGFAHTGKHAFARAASGGDDALDFAAAHGVKAAAQIRQRAHHAKVGVGLHRKTHQPFKRGKCVIQLGEVVGERFG